MTTVDWDLVETFKAQLALCGVKPGVLVAALSEGDMRQDYAQATMIATQTLGGEAFHVNLPLRASGKFTSTGKTPLDGNRPVVESLKQADLIMDFVGLLFSREQNEMLASGTRILMVTEPLHVLKALAPSKDLRRRVEFAGNLLEQAKELRFTSPHGTDVTYKLNQYPV